MLSPAISASSPCLSHPITEALQTSQAGCGNFPLPLPASLQRGPHWPADSMLCIPCGLMLQFKRAFSGGILADITLPKHPRSPHCVTSASPHPSPFCTASSASLQPTLEPNIPL